MIRFGPIRVVGVALLTIGISTIVRPAPRFIWNDTASTPIGFYALRSADTLHVTDLVAVMPPPPIARFLAAGGYLPEGVPLLKHILALPGQIVCRRDRTITVDGIPVGKTHLRDSRGRELPVWQGCQTIASGEIFLMNSQVADSLDGRYFGPLPTRSVIGRAVPLWTDETGDGHFEWHATEH